MSIDSQPFQFTDDVGNTILGQTIPVGSNTKAKSIPVCDTNSAAFTDWPAVAVGDALTNCSSLGVLCTVAGKVTVKSANGNTLAWPVVPGWNILAFAVVQITASTATATYYNLQQL